MKRPTAAADLRRHVEAAERAGVKSLGIRLPEGVGGPATAVDSSPRRRNKYNAVPTIHNGQRFDSKAEAERARYLDSLAPAGVWYVRQPTFRLGCPENVYRADFLVVPGLGGVVHVEDVKGVATAKFLRDLKLWRAYGHCELWVITKGKVVQVIKPEPKP